MPSVSSLRDALYDFERNPDPHILALGLGGAGNDLLTHLMDTNPRGVYCIAADTDRYHLPIVRAHSKLLLEDGSCPDAGTKGNVEIGRKVGAEGCIILRPIFETADIVFILAGMGGGTGGGAAPVIAEAARKSGAIVVGIVTKPYHFERERFSVAIYSLRSMLASCDTVILADNRHPSFLVLPLALNRDLPGQTSSSLISSIADVFANPSLLSGELRELRSMLRCGGLATGGYSHSYSIRGAEDAALKALRSSVPAGYVSNATGVFLNIVGDKSLQDEDVESAVGLVSRKINPAANLLCTRRVETNLGGTTISLLATGVTFPFSWGGYRKFPIEIFEMEPESAEENTINLEFDLDQIEAVRAI